MTRMDGLTLASALLHNCKKAWLDPRSPWSWVCAGQLARMQAVESPSCCSS